MENFDLDAFFESDGFNSLDDEGKTLLREFTRRVSGKSPAEALTVLMEYRKREAGKIDPAKSEMLICALKSSLTPEGRTRLETMERMLTGRFGNNEK